MKYSHSIALFEWSCKAH